MIQTRKPASLSDLRSVVLRPPEGSAERWKGVPHADLVEAFQAEFLRRGWPFGPFAAALSSYGSPGVAMAGGWRWVKPCGEPGFTFALGLVNSNNWRHHRGVIATYPGIHADGLFVPLAEVKMGRHVQGFDPRSAVDNACDKAAKTWNKAVSTVERLKARNLASDKAHDLLWTAGEKRLAPWSRIGRAAKTYQDRPQTAWGLLLCFAAEAKRGPAMSQLQNVHAFLESL